MRCADASAGEPLAGTATVASRFLLLEHRGRWGRDPLDDETALAGPAGALARGFDGRVLLLRRSERRSGPPAAAVVEVGREEGALLPAGLPAREDLLDPVLVVCTHGRRDGCCARQGRPLYDALGGHVEPHRLWQSSHHGGHRFAANLLALPAGIQLGRVFPVDAARVAAILAEGRIPLQHYRGRTLDPPRVQAADAALRRHLGLDGGADVRPLDDDGAVVTLATPGGAIRVRVTEEAGPLLPASCGAEPEPTVRLVAHPE